MLVGLLALLTAPSSRVWAADAVPAPGGYLDSMEWYERAAKSGDPQAQYLFGEILSRGLRGAADRKAAADWFEKAARQGHGLAAFALAGAYESGRGRDRDRAKAAEW